MNWNLRPSLGWIVLVGVPLVLWLIPALSIRRKGWSARLLAFVAGSDNRLSLARVQAFAWTLVIFGSYMTAMAVHRRIVTGDPEAARLAAATAKAADSVAVVAAGVAAARLIDGSATAAQADTAARRAAERAVRARVEASRFAWVQIPPSLLALAGIAISSGIFSSLIAGANAEQKTACLTGVQVVAFDSTFPTRYPGASPAATPYCLEISGAGLEKPGSVRLNGRLLRTPYWADTGNVIVADLPLDIVSPRVLIVDTPAGKLSHDLLSAADATSAAAMVAIAASATATTAATAANAAAAALRAVIAPGGIAPLQVAAATAPAPTIVLGSARFEYEFADLFRDDKKPSDFALTKLQMFGWTVVALFIYVWLFLGNLTDHLTTLPIVDQSIVILTGLSQAGYLAGKATS